MYPHAQMGVAGGSPLVGVHLRFEEQLGPSVDLIAQADDLRVFWAFREVQSHGGENG